MERAVENSKHNLYFCSMERLKLYSTDTLSSLELPFAEEGVRAGFPSPAQDYMENSIDLNRDLVRHPESTFYARVAGNSMIDADLNEGDILIIDKSLEAKSGDVAVCVVNGEFTVKTLDINEDRVVLQPANDEYQPIVITEADNFEVWGVVTYVIKSLKKRN